MNKEYKELMKEIKSWYGCKAFMFQRDVNEMCDKKNNLFNNGVISYDQAIRIEKEIDRLVA